MLAGPSGFGKTTLAKYLSEQTGIPYESGSVSDLLPETKDIPHQEMLSRDPQDLYREDWQILNKRNRLFNNKSSYISDRSYLDSAAYFLYKQADKIPGCEIEHFLATCKRLLINQCDCLIFLNFLPSLEHIWDMEDNGKRITSNYFQITISSIMRNCLDLLGYNGRPYMEYRPFPKNLLSYILSQTVMLKYGIEEGEIQLDTFEQKVKVIVINEPCFETRTKILESKLSLWKRIVK